MECNASSLQIKYCLIMCDWRNCARQIEWARWKSSRSIDVSLGIHCFTHNVIVYAFLGVSSLQDRLLGDLNLILATIIALTTWKHFLRIALQNVRRVQHGTSCSWKWLLMTVTHLSWLVLLSFQCKQIPGLELSTAYNTYFFYLSSLVMGLDPFQLGKKTTGLVQFGKSLFIILLHVSTTLPMKLSFGIFVLKAFTLAVCSKLGMSVPLLEKCYLALRLGP